MKYCTAFVHFILILVFPIQLYATSPATTSSSSYHKQGQSSKKIKFSSQELDYLKSKKQIAMCIDPSWMPLESISDGKHIGMTADYIQVMQQHLPVPVVMVPVVTWPQSVEFAKARKCDIFSLAMPTPEREEYMDFTQPYLSIPLVMAAQINKPFVDDITTLENITLGVVKGYAFGELLRVRFSEMTLIDVDNVDQGLQLVVEGELDGFIGTLATVGYSIQKGFPDELKVAGKFDERWELGIATRNDEPFLHSIFDKIIGSLDQKTHQSILNHWISVKFDQKKDYTTLYQVLFVSALGFILLLLKNYGLRKYTTKLKAQNDEIILQKEKLLKTEKLLQLTQHGVDASFFPILWAIQGESLAQTRIVYANQAAGDLLGYQSKKLAKLTLADLDVESTDASWNLSLQHVQETTGLRVKTLYRCCNKVLLPVELFVSKFSYLGLKYLFLFVVDRTKQLEIEAKLHRSMKMESIGLMAGGVAHDLNNILSGIIGYPDLLLLNLPEDDKMRNSIEAIKESGLRASEIVADLLTVARGVAAEKTVSNLNVLITEYCQSPECDGLKAAYPSVSFEHYFDDDLLNVECSTVHVKKCIMNLVVNAVESLGEQPGTISITTENAYLEKPLVHHKIMDLGEYVIVIIADTGKGISRDDIAHIFEPFYTKKKMGRSGTGLGLSVVWNTLEDHGGTVIVSSSDAGTVFTLYFPATRKELVESADSVRFDDLVGNGQTILIVDDVKQQQHIATQMLTSLGYNAFAVASGEEAVAYVKENPVDLLVLDMIMDPGINGRETYEQILKVNPQQKAIIASGFSANQEVKLAQKLGAGIFIKKPYLINQIGTAVKETLES